MLVEAVEQLLDQPGLGQLLPEQPQRRGVRNTVLDREPQKARERQPVAHLIFHLLVRQIVERLQHQHLNIRMASNGFRPALLFLSSSGVSTTASISARKLSHGTR